MIDDLTTVLITTSPRPRHPDTGQIRDTIASVRWHLPEAQIIVCCDGVRPYQEHRRAAYCEFQERLGNLIGVNGLENIGVLRLLEFEHQARAVARGLELVKTPLILFTEDDQQLLPIDNPWDDMAKVILEHRVNLIRFMLEPVVNPEWQKFMLGPLNLNGFDTVLTRTVQWSQRTHLASTEYYRAMVREHVKPADRCYLEERLYGQCDDWETHKLCLYTPPPPMNRIWHSDGRGSEPKFDSVLEGKE